MTTTTTSPHVFAVGDRALLGQFTVNVIDIRRTDARLVVTCGDQHAIVAASDLVLIPPIVLVTGDRVCADDLTDNDHYGIFVKHIDADRSVVHVLGQGALVCARHKLVKIMLPYAAGDKLRCIRAMSSSPMGEECTLIFASFNQLYVKRAKCNNNTADWSYAMKDWSSLIKIDAFTPDLPPPGRGVGVKRSRMTLADLRSLPSDVTSTHDATRQCTVCYTNHQDHALTCGHVFCIKCIDSSAEAKRPRTTLDSEATFNCPMCRADVCDVIRLYLGQPEPTTIATPAGSTHLMPMAQPSSSF